MTPALSVLEAVPDDPALQAAIAERQEHLRRSGESPWYVTTSAAELVLSHRLATDQAALTPYQLQVAQEQHLCRITRAAAHACMRLVTVGETCSVECPVALRRRAHQRLEHAFVTDWYMPEAHALIDPEVEVPPSSH